MPSRPSIRATQNTQMGSTRPRTSPSGRFHDEKYFSSSDEDQQSMDYQTSDDDGYDAVPYEAEKKCFLIHPSVDEKYYSDSENGHERHSSDSDVDHETYDSGSEHANQDNDLKLLERRRGTGLHYSAHTSSPLEQCPAVPSCNDDKYYADSEAGGEFNTNGRADETQHVRKTVRFNGTRMHGEEKGYRTRYELGTRSDGYVPGRWSNRCLWTWLGELALGTTWWLV